MRQQITAAKGAKPVGPYSHAIAAKGTLVYVSGQGPLNPETNELVMEFRQAVIQTLTNVKTIVEAAGATMADVVKTNAFLSDMANFPIFNEIYATFFQEPYPARTTVQCALPMGIPVEVEVVVVLPE
jgi:2-iminobutanoate/2-iminopropanoate deaminase